MSADPQPREILADLDDDESDECIYIDRRDDAYLWADEDDGYRLLERTRSGSWLPYPKPVDEDAAKHLLAEVLDDDTAAYEVQPQINLPPGRHRIDRQ